MIKLLANCKTAHLPRTMLLLSKLPFPNIPISQYSNIALQHKPNTQLCGLGSPIVFTINIINTFYTPSVAGSDP